MSNFYKGTRLYKTPHWFEPENVKQAYRDEATLENKDLGDDMQGRSESIASEMQRMAWRERKRYTKRREHEIPCGFMRTEQDLAALRAVSEQKRPRERLDNEDWEGLRETRQDSPRRNGPVIVVYSREQAARGVPQPADIEEKYGKTGRRLPSRNPPWRAKIETSQDGKAVARASAF